MSNPFSYEDKRVVVTGGATGVGAGLLDVLAEQGAEHVTVLDLKEPTGPHDDFISATSSDQAAVDRRGRRASTGPSTCCSTTPASPTRRRRRRSSRSTTSRCAASRRACCRPIPDGGAIVNTASIAGGQWPTHLDMINELLDLGGLGVDAGLDRRATSSSARSRTPSPRSSCRCTRCARRARRCSAGCAPTACARRRSTRRCSRTSGRR